MTQTTINAALLYRCDGRSAEDARHVVRHDPMTATVLHVRVFVVVVAGCSVLACSARGLCSAPSLTEAARHHQSATAKVQQFAS
jgi:hypothetical protein